MKPATSRLYLVDVFAERPYAGNPLAVVVGDALPEAAMHRVAAEINFSETTFLDPAPSRDGGYRVRIFTPAREIAFAGHPLLGTAWIVRHHVALERAASVRLDLALGPVPVTFESSGGEGDVAWFLAPAITAGPVCAPERIAAALGLTREDIETSTPVRQMGAGTSAMLVPVRGLDALSRARLDLEAFAPLAREGFPPLAYLFCSETREAGNDLSARFFFEAHGVREDPATGNGAAFLGAYLLEHGASPSLALRIEQGYEMGRPSLVRVRAESTGGRREIRVGGRVIETALGELL